MAIEPIKWASSTPANPRGRKLDFVDYIDADLQNAISVHDGLVKTWIRWLELYRAPVKQPERNIPYEGAANFMLPTIATDNDQLYAKFIQTLHAAENLWSLKPLNERWTDAAKPLEDLLTWLDHNVLKMYNVNKRVLAEMTKLGTGIYKTGWTYENRPVWTYDPSGKAVKASRIVGKPFVDHVRLADFVFPPNAYDIDPDAQGGAPWVGERIRVSVERLKWMATSSAPFLPNIDKETLNKVIHFEEFGETDWDSEVQRHDYEKIGAALAPDFDTDGDKRRSTSGQANAPGKVVREIEFWEIHARFPTQSNDSQDDVVVWYHKPTKLIVRGVYQYYRHGKRPYDVVRLFPGDGFYGIGMCEQTEFFQLADSDLFNFMWDNVFLANSRMIVAQAGANIAPGEPVYPNKVWIVDGPVNQQFGVFPMADIYQSLPQLMEITQARKERRNGIGDLQLGNMQSLPSRTPATTALSLLQEGARRPDLTIKDMRYDGLSVVGLRMLQLLQQYATSPEDVGGQNLLKIAKGMLGNPEGAIAAEKLTMPMEAVEYGLGCAITATSGNQNKETSKQDYLALLQLAPQIGQQMIQFAQIAQQFQGTTMGQVAEDTFYAVASLGKRALEQYDIRDIESIIPSPTAAAQSAQQPPAAGFGAGAPVPAQPQPGPGGGAPGAPLDASLAALFGGTTAGL